MPRLPTIRVIGSQDISTSFRDSAGASRAGAVTVAMGSLLSGLRVSRGVVSGGQVVAPVAPLRLLVGRGVGVAAQGPDNAAVDRDRIGGNGGAGGLVHEGHELVGEAGHGAADA